MYPFITCLCPTYGRPLMLSNAIACFLNQNYPGNRCQLYVYDDLGTVRKLEIPKNLTNERAVWLHSEESRYPSLPEKYNAMWRDALNSAHPRTDIFVIWEDDDIQLPWCLSSIAESFTFGYPWSSWDRHADDRRYHAVSRHWSYPYYVWSDYGGDLHTEQVGGNFHGSIAIGTTLLQEIGGWPVTRRADFDQQFIARLYQASAPTNPNTFGMRWADSLAHELRARKIPCTPSLVHEVIRGVQYDALNSPMNMQTCMPAYVYRWGTGYAHGQSTMRSPDDETWYDRYMPPDMSIYDPLPIRMDQQTRRIYQALDAVSTYAIPKTGLWEPSAD